MFESGSNNVITDVTAAVCQLSRQSPTNGEGVGGWGGEGGRLSLPRANGDALEVILISLIVDSAAGNRFLSNALNLFNFSSAWIQACGVFLFIAVRDANC